nr:hypothetical protein asmbl_10 [uncultured bacterium]
MPQVESVGAAGPAQVEVEGFLGGRTPQRRRHGGSTRP